MFYLKIQVDLVVVFHNAILQYTWLFQYSMDYILSNISGRQVVISRDFSSEKKLTIVNSILNCIKNEGTQGL